MQADEDNEFHMRFEEVIDRIIVDPECLYIFLDIEQDLCDALAGLCLTNDDELDPRAKPVVKCIKEQAYKYIDSGNFAGRQV